MRAEIGITLLKPASSPGRDYADYLQLDQLLTLQTPCSSQPDEVLFITFHQMAEMVFALVIRELATLTAEAPVPSSAWHQPLDRICALIRLLVFQMRVFAETLDRGQFLAFRDSLGQASGLQSVQFRRIELMSARLQSLATDESLAAFPAAAPADAFAKVHWRFRGCPAAVADHTGDGLADLASRMTDRNLAHRYSGLSDCERADPGLRQRLADYDRLINRVWGALHLRCAGMMLGGQEPRDLGTGGTDWRRYLAERLDRSFFPELHHAT